MDEIELPTSGETPEERQHWIVGLCMEMAFAHTQVPYEVIATEIEAASVVLSPFEGGGVER
jgi:hypothetical protein